MQKMGNFLDYPRQKQTVPLPNGETFTISLYYIQRQMGWFIEEINYNGFRICGLRLVNSPNILRQFRNKLPFGIAVWSDDKREPLLMSDLNSGHTKIYVISKEEVEQVEEYLRG